MRLLARLLQDDALDDLDQAVVFRDSLYQGWYVIISLVSKEIRREGDNIAVRQSHYDLAILSR